MTRADHTRSVEGRWAALGLVLVVDVLAMGLWFTASYVVPQIRAEWRLDPAGAGSLTVVVQLGFVAGALFGALLNLAPVSLLPA